MPLLVETNNIPILYAGRNCLSQLKYASFLTEKRGVMMPHLFTLQAAVRGTYLPGHHPPAQILRYIDSFALRARLRLQTCLPV
jgi:hypothetical protein